MNQLLDVLLYDQKVGQVLLKKEGLYWKIQCSVITDEIGYYHLFVENSNTSLDLGLCIPTENGYELKRRIPMKQIGEINLKFFIRSNVIKNKKCFVPVDTQKPFPYLQNLEQAHLESRDGILGICFEISMPESDHL